jgi:GNAT superfamily N-acetyltransferase
MRIRAEVAENRLTDPASVGEDAYARFIAAGCCWVWDDDRTVLGFSAVDLEAGSLWALFVRPQASGRGIGRALLEAAVRRARECNLCRLRLTTAKGTRAERVYRTAGWRPAGEDASGDLILIRDIRPNRVKSY